MSTPLDVAILDVVILAAGQGKRMQSDLPKVLHTIAGKSMLSHVLDTASDLDAERCIVVYGYGGEQVKAGFATATDLIWAEQQQLLGTGDAVAQALPYLQPQDVALILYGDVPLIRQQTLLPLIASALAGRVGLLTVVLDDPGNYGRILRDDNDHVTAIVEQRDCTAEQQQIKEINTGILAVPGDYLQRWIPQLNINNAQGEYYLTDIIAMAVADGITIDAVVTQDPNEVQGVNDRMQLAQLERVWQRRRVEQLMLAGVTVRDPARLDIRGNVSSGRDVVIDINVILEGDVTLGKGVQIGANCIIRDSVIGDYSVIHANSIIETSMVARYVNVGPFARLRPGAELQDNVRVGNFVEVKNSLLAEGAKANHLTYVGDAEVGRDVNIGAGTITANYDGANKHKTVIGDNASIGSNSVLVAPIIVGEKTTVGAGSVLSRNIPDDVLVFTRAPSKQVAGWQRPLKKSKSKK